jgi:hypothetical protein
MSNKNSLELEHIKMQLSEFVNDIPFNNLSVLLAFLTYVEEASQNIQNTSLEQIFADWQPNSIQMVDEFGGTNCVGLTEIFKKKLLKENPQLTTSYMAAVTELLPSGLPYQNYLEFCHFALKAMIDGEHYLFDPGLGLVLPINLKDETYLESEHTHFQVKTTDQGYTLNIINPRNLKTLAFFFKDVPQDFNPEVKIQKPLLRGTTAFKIDAINNHGQKIASLKLDFMTEKILVLYSGAKPQSIDTKAYDFTELEKLFLDPIFTELCQELKGEVSKIQEQLTFLIANRRHLQGIWYEPLQRQYFLEHGELLSSHQTSWEELANKGYRGGGVVLVLENELGQVMYYEVPEGKDKPHIGRIAGQANLFVETADHLPNTEAVVTNLEPFNQNLERALQEELGLTLNDIGKFDYYETDYNPQIRARIVHAKVNSVLLEKVNRHITNQAMIARSEQKQVEMGLARWIPTNQLSGLNELDLEPQARKLINILITNGKMTLGSAT